MPTPTMLPTTRAVAPIGLRRWSEDADGAVAGAVGAGGGGAGVLAPRAGGTVAVACVELTREGRMPTSLLGAVAGVVGTLRRATCGEPACPGAQLPTPGDQPVIPAV